ncbi:hypothetical protein KCU90_g3772, partial [Aureobasidium melanogenum]
MNDARHDAKLAMNVPSGTPITVAQVTPVRIVAIALAESFGRTRRADAAVAKVQNPPNAAPSSARPTSMNRKSGANAEIRFDASSKAVSNRNTRRRSIRPATSIKPGAEMAAMTPGTVTINPAVPGITPRSAAMRGSSPTGKNSVVTKAKAPIATATTASQERRDDDAPSSGEAVLAGRLSSINIVLFAGN